MRKLKITAGPFNLTGELELEKAPKTCAAFIKALPFVISETEILLAYGGVRFASKVGQLAGNHFLTITSGLEDVTKLGVSTLWDGAQDIRFEAAE
jgi:hypothetical protein